MSMVGSQASEESKQSELQCRRLCLYCGYVYMSVEILSTFNALTLLVGWQEGHLACKN